MYIYDSSILTAGFGVSFGTFGTGIQLTTFQNLIGQMPFWSGLRARFWTWSFKIQDLEKT